MPAAMGDQVPVLPMMMSESFAKDAIIAWFRGEFAAANAIIDALCNHIRKTESGGRSEYDAVFAAIHRRRLNWIPILQMQKFYSIAEVSGELGRVSEKKVGAGGGFAKKIEKGEVLEEIKEVYEVESSPEKIGIDGGDAVAVRDRSPGNDVTDATNVECQEAPPASESSEENNIQEAPPASENSEENDIQEAPPASENSEENNNSQIELCPDQKGGEEANNSEERRAQMKMTKGFIAKESVKGHMVNVVRGLKLYEEIFNESEIAKLSEYVNELRAAGRGGELSGETYILYNQQIKGKKRELVQFGAPIFGQIKEDAATKQEKSPIEPIPTLLQGAIDRLIDWNLISENRKPNSCIINFFDEGEFSQPFLKPPHLEQPISTLLLSESTMAFGRALVCDSEGNYNGSLMLTLKEGSLLVMRGNSSDMSRHVMCPSPNKRVSVTFFRVRSEINQNNNNNNLQMAPLNKAMTLWQPPVPNTYQAPNLPPTGYEAMNAIQKWGVLRGPLLMLAPIRPMIVGPKKLPRGGTGVFLPWTVQSRKPMKQLPPRAQRSRLLALTAGGETHACGGDQSLKIEGKMT